jgi:hypothetical protein
MAPGSPAPTPEQRRRRTATVSVIGVVIALVWSVILASHSRPPTGMPDVEAGQYLATSGHREFLSNGPQTTIIETSHLPGAIAFSDPPLIMQQVLDTISYEQASAGYWIREIWQTRSAITSRLLMLSDDAGLVLYAIDGTDRLAFDSGLVELPADAVPGASWTSQATATDADGVSTSWSRTGSIGSAAEQGCLEITTTDRYGDTETTSVTTRCPQRGIVAVDQAAAGEPPAVDTSGLRLRPHPDLMPASDPITTTILTGEVAMAVGMTTPPVAVGDGLVFANRTNGHLDFVSPGANGQWTLSTVRRPGLDMTALLDAGEMVVAATTDRALVAYDRHGRWVWQADLPDIASDLFWVDDEAAAALTLDGQLTIFAVSDGRTIRTTDMPAGSTVGPAVVQGDSGALIATASERQIAILNAEDRVTTLEVRDDVRSLAMTHQAVVVSDVTADLTAFTLAGDRLWRVGMPDSCRQLVATDELVVCRLPNAIAAIDPASGRVIWRAELSALAIYVADGQILSMGRQTTTLLSTSGDELGSWQIERTASNTWAVPMTGGLLVTSDIGEFEWWPA